MTLTGATMWKICRACLVKDSSLLMRMDKEFFVQVPRSVHAMFISCYPHENIEPYHYICMACVMALNSIHKFNANLRRAAKFFDKLNDVNTNSRNLYNCTREMDATSNGNDSVVPSESFVKTIADISTNLNEIIASCQSEAIDVRDDNTIKKEEQDMEFDEAYAHDTDYSNFHEESVIDQQLAENDVGSSEDGTNSDADEDDLPLTHFMTNQSIGSGAAFERKMIFKNLNKSHLELKTTEGTCTKKDAHLNTSALIQSKNELAGVNAANIGEPDKEMQLAESLKNANSFRSIVAEPPKFPEDASILEHKDKQFAPEDESSDQKNSENKSHVLDTKHICGVCKNHYNDKASLHRHFVSRHKAAIKSNHGPFPCSFCSKEFKHKESLRQHKAQKHRDKLAKPSNISHINNEELINEINSNYVIRLEGLSKGLEDTSTSSSCNKELVSNNASKQNPMTSQDLTKHKTTHGRALFICKLCRKELTSLQTLTDHFREVHPNENAFICHVCERPFNDRYIMRVHRLSHTITESPHKCNVCQKPFATKPALKSHMFTHASERAFMCATCGRSFNFQCSLRRHERVMHPNDAHPRIVKKVFKCEVCARPFQRADKMRKHAKRHTDERPYVCDICDRTLYTKCDLKRHTLTHATAEQKHTCHTCGKEFVTDKCLRKHTLDVHASNVTSMARTTEVGELIKSEKMFVCEVCGKAFAKRDHLRRHAYAHTTVRPHACGKCDRRFKSAEALSQHAFTHSGAKPYVCGTCNARFAYKRKLTEHMMLHTGEMPYSCAACDRAFRLRASLADHFRRNHSMEGSKRKLKKNFICDAPECGKAFANSHKLKTHVDCVHKKLKLFACDTCNKPFGDQRNLRVHMRLHTGEKPFTCRRCAKAFVSSGNCRAHERKCVKNEENSEH